jgi:Tol biopolymer transport system component
LSKVPLPYSIVLENSPLVLSEPKELRMRSFTKLSIAHFLFTFLISSSALGQPASIWNPQQWHLWRIEVDGTGLRPLDQTTNNRCGSPVWSSDGKFIVYDITDASISPRVVVIRSDGTGRQVLEHGSMPCWSPDGKLILCEMGGPAFMDPDGRGVEVLPGPAFSLRWSPRDNLIASLRGPELPTLYLFNLATEVQTKTSTGKYPIYHGYDFSSDGKQICFGSPRAGLCIATVDPQASSAKVTPLVDTGIGFHASWSPDDSQIVFAWQQSPPDGLIQIYIYDLSTGGPPKLLPGLDLSRHNVNPAWSPDGRTIAFSSPPAAEE